MTGLGPVKTKNLSYTRYIYLLGEDVMVKLRRKILNFIHVFLLTQLIRMQKIYFIRSLHAIPSHFGRKDTLYCHSLKDKDYVFC